MASPIVRGQNFGSTETVTATKLQNIVDNSTFKANNGSTQAFSVSGSTDIGTCVKDGGLQVHTTGQLQVEDLKITTGKVANNAITLAKMATQADQTVLANVSGGTAVPTAVPIVDNAGILINDDALGTSDTKGATQGNIKAYVDANDTIVYRSSFTQCPAGGASQSFSHGLSGVPDIVSVQVKAKTASNGFAEGEIVILANSYAYVSYGQGIEVNSSNVVFHVGGNGLQVIAPDGSYVALTETNFEIKVIAAIL